MSTPIELRTPADAKKVGAAVEASMQKKLKRAVLSAAMKIHSYIVTELIPNAKPFPPVDRGIYRAAWKYKRTDYGAVVENTAPHAPIIEHGARAKNIRIGRRMIQELTDWVLRHDMVARTRTVSVGGKTKRVKVDNLDRLTQARQIAWAIAMKMKERGIFDGGLHIAEKARKAAPAFLRAAVAHEMAR